MMKESIMRFNEQFDWEPVIENAVSIKKYDRYIVVGMGGSHLAGWLLHRYTSLNNVTIHWDYGVPTIPDSQKESTLIVLSSYSGNTEEVLDAGRIAMEQGLAIVAISKGGDLMHFANSYHIPYIQLPESGLEPRMAIGYSLVALMRFMQDSELEVAIRSHGRSVDVLRDKSYAQGLAGRLVNKVPIIYTSNHNDITGYFWKIKFNETAKIPAFMNVVSEMCHNELSGFDVVETTRDLTSNMSVLLIEDESDHDRIKVRMNTLANVLSQKGIPVERISLEGENHFIKAFQSAIMADWTSMYLADYYGVPNPETPLIAEFKKQILI